MMKEKTVQKLIALAFIFGVFLPLSFVSAFGILSSNKYAWSDNVGYINFAPANAGVNVSDSALSGHAWSENNGYINFAPAEGGVFNDGTGNLSGSAWGEGLGYIDFDNVSIDPSTGQFSGTATGPLIGTLTFDCGFCDVQTDWRPVSGEVAGASSGSIPGSDQSLDEEIDSTDLGIPASTSLPTDTPVGGSGVQTSSLQASVGAALFDVISEPALPIQANKISPVLLSVLGGVITAGLVLLILIRAKLLK